MVILTSYSHTLYIGSAHPDLLGPTGGFVEAFHPPGSGVRLYQVGRAVRRHRYQRVHFQFPFSEKPSGAKEVVSRSWQD